MTSATPPPCSLSDIESTSLIKQDTTASLLIIQLISCSLVCSPPHMLLDDSDSCSLFAWGAAVGRVLAPTVGRVASKAFNFKWESVSCENLCLNARPSCHRVVPVRVGAIKCAVVRLSLHAGYVGITCHVINI